MGRPGREYLKADIKVKLRDAKDLDQSQESAGEH